MAMKAFYLVQAQFTCADSWPIRPKGFRRECLEVREQLEVGHNDVNAWRKNPAIQWQNRIFCLVFLSFTSAEPSSKSTSELERERQFGGFGIVGLRSGVGGSLG
ncbi:hypothetical protein B0H13DRAFT_1853880 [Mycena leptocephala]|nr:hypothetical protein B0H13DRAFT_1853880 [Mycena leptocephala]